MYSQTLCAFNLGTSIEASSGNVEGESIVRQKPNIPEGHLYACLQAQYAISAVSVEFLPLGLDTRAGVYRVVSKEGNTYLLKVKSGLLYKPSWMVPDYLRDQSIAAVVAPLATKRKTLWTAVAPLLTKRKTLWTQVGDWTVTVYPFIDGETGWNLPMTDEQWYHVGATLNQIHRVRLPPEILESVRKETFDPTAYTRWVQAFETYQARSTARSQVVLSLHSAWKAHQATIHRAMTSLEKLAGALQQQAELQVICHGDLHPGNMIRSHANQVFLIDWDDVRLALKERDFLFVWKAPADGSPPHDIAPFFEGYGQPEIDWVALTYYRWERVIQNLIVCAEDACFRGDLEEATKAVAVELFRELFAAGAEVDSAFAAETHLPSELR